MLLESLNKFIQNICMYVTLHFGSQHFPRITSRTIYLFFFFFFCCFSTETNTWLHTLIYLCVYLFLLAVEGKNIPLFPKTVQITSVSAYFRRAFDSTWLAKIALTRWWRTVHGATRGKIIGYLFVLLLTTLQFTYVAGFFNLCFLLMDDSATKYVLFCCVLCWGPPTTDFGTLRVAFIGSFPHYLTLLNSFQFHT